LNGDSYRLKQSKAAAGKAEIPRAMKRRPARSSIQTPVKHHPESRRKAKSPLREEGFLLQSAILTTSRLLLRRAGRKLLRR